MPSIESQGHSTNKLLQTLRHQPFKLVIFPLLILSLFCWLVAAYFYQQQALQQAIDTYGEDLTKVAAELTADEALNKDAISLQAIVRKVSNNTRAESIVVYDIDHSILTQVISENSNVVPLIFFTQPININDNLAGSITIGVAPWSSKLTLIPSLLLILSLIIWLASIYLSLKISHIHQSENVKKSDNEITIPETNEIDVETDIILFVQINNIAQIFQQLNKEFKERQFFLLQQQIEKINTLYQGKVSGITENGLLIKFSESYFKDKIKPIESALYTSKLIIDLNRSLSESILVLNTYIYDVDTLNLQSINSLNKLASARDNQLLLDKNLYKKISDTNILDVTEYSTEEDFITIEIFNKDYAELLENQLRQLQKH